MLFGTSRTSRNRRTARPGLEDLENRSLLCGYSPTDIEELYLQELNDARFNPAAYGVSLGLDLSSVAPSQPLAMSPLLVESARLHSQDMIAQNYFGHTTPQGVGPEQRIEATGFEDTGYAESIENNTNPTPANSRFPANYAASDTALQPLQPDRRPGSPGPRPPRHAPGHRGPVALGTAGWHRHRIAGHDFQRLHLYAKPTRRSTSHRPPTPTRS